MKNLEPEDKFSSSGYEMVKALHNHTKGKILLVDDNPFSRLNLVDLLNFEGYEVVEIDEHVDVIYCVNQVNPDLILLELNLPKQNPLEICKNLKESEVTALIPIVFITVRRDRESRLQSLNAGGDDLLVKPIDRLELTSRVKSLIRQKHLNENLDKTEEVLFRLAGIMENPYLDNYSSVSKLAVLTQEFGKYLQLNERQIQSLIYAAYLHDVGTVVLPESIMLKKGELTELEREIVNQHVLIGEKICQPLKNRLDILPIIRHHHERWDGSGYPDGLIGSDIPWLAQVFQIVDIYHAITNERPYKQALSPLEAMKIIAEETAKGWRNPELVKEFITFISQTESIALNHIA
ncbi:HD domain-containing phosphohydrolase [Gloeocapsa sp. PCC 73106]|uniref:response regulator n=1 Tax=Gloeocapsa sp. PCC 73106 TaxID=102232 RepID=UPI0002ABC8E2|nr:HD domain-containing phosphohydrolase [Gloeocapsa sp. PCC 73106]ELR96660.1 response regulator containing a CheY-like receiver domain and an HD-GYP domain [Gloeocapsa sp. PCC 73106]